jgi:hypothetical protein
MTDVHLRHLDNRATMRVRVVITRELRVRLWIGAQLIKLAARIMHVDIVVERSAREEP